MATILDDACNRVALLSTARCVSRVALVARRAFAAVEIVIMRISTRLWFDATCSRPRSLDPICVSHQSSFSALTGTARSASRALVVLGNVAGDVIASQVRF